MREILVNGEVRTVYFEYPQPVYGNDTHVAIYYNTITLLFDFGSLLIQLDGPVLHENDIQEISGAPLKPGNLWEMSGCHRTAGMVKLNCGAELPVTYFLNGLESCHITIMKDCKLKSAKERDLRERKAHDQAKAQAIKQPAAAPEAPGAQPEPLELSGALLALIRREIENELDGKVKAIPLHSDFFIRYTKDKTTIAAMARPTKGHRAWARRTCNLRKRKLDDFLMRKHKLTLEVFLMADEAIFHEAQTMINDWRAKGINRRKLARESEDSDD